MAVFLSGKPRLLLRKLFTNEYTKSLEKGKNTNAQSKVTLS
jgi:hypothetical protein